MRRILIIVAILLVPLVPIVLVVTGVIGTKPTTVSNMTLTVWGTQDTSTMLADSIGRYRSTRPYARIAYTQVRPEDYLDQLVRGWATGTGPDIFFVPNTWVGQMEQYAVPMPASLTVPQVLSGRGLFGNTTEVVSTPVAAPSAASYQQQFVDGISADFIRDGQVWGLPMALDTIVLYYNKDLLNNAQIFSPARTWTELLTQIDLNRLTATDDEDTIVRAAIGLGAADNIPYATDILTLLFLQNGVPEVKSGSRANLRTESAATAFDFYLSFSDPKKVSYSWNEAQPNAKQAFLDGRVAYYLGTYEDRRDISSSSLSWGVSPMLHLATDGDNDASSQQRRFINAARYQVLMVSKASQLANRSRQAWNFIYSITHERNVPMYLGATNRLAAIKGLLEKQTDRPDYQVFAPQMLTARSWYRGKEGASLEEYLRNMIITVLRGQATVDDALRLAADQINANL